MIPTKDWRWPDDGAAKVERADLIAAVKDLLGRVEGWIESEYGGTSMRDTAMADLQRWRDMLARAEGGEK